LGFSSKAETYPSSPTFMMPKRVASSMDTCSTEMVQAAPPDVLGEHEGVVHLVDVVAGEDEHAVRVVHFDKAHVLIDGVGRAGKPGALFPAD
jgi:hypothetical protein